MWAINFLGVLVFFVFIAILLSTIVLIALLVKFIMEEFEDDDKNFWNN